MPDITGTLTLDTANPQLGQPCQFTVTTEGLQGKKFPHVHVRAFQNGNVVYGQTLEVDGGEPYADNGPVTFPALGGTSGNWPNVPPPPAPPPDPHAPTDCTARLFYADQHGDQITLAELTFVAAGL